MPSILLLQGPNMRVLGQRQPDLYGSTSRAQLDAMLTRHAEKRAAVLRIHYTEAEGDAIATIRHALEDGTRGLLMNPAGFNQAGYGLRDCLAALPLPYIEVHMTNMAKRGRHSVLADLADGVIAGFGVTSYVLAIDAMLERLR